MTSAAVIVPCYNAARTLGETLDSVLAQGDSLAEIVVVDDGSTDDTLAIARRYEPRVRVLTGPNAGVSAARNRGIAETSAEWIVFLDSDDHLAPGTLSRRLAVAGEGAGDVVACDWEDMVDDGTDRTAAGAVYSIDWQAMAGDAEAAIASHVWATTAALMYRRSLVQRIGGFRRDLPVIQDARFMFDAAHFGGRFVHAPHVGARYRIHPASLSRRNPGRFWRDVLLNGGQIELLWRGQGRMEAGRVSVLADIYNNAARGLFAAGDPAYFEAVSAQRRVAPKVPRHSALVAPLAGLVGLRTARLLVSLCGK